MAFSPANVSTTPSLLNKHFPDSIIYEGPSINQPGSSRYTITCKVCGSYCSATDLQINHISSLIKQYQDSHSPGCKNYQNASAQAREWNTWQQQVANYQAEQNSLQYSTSTAGSVSGTLGSQQLTTQSGLSGIMGQSLGTFGNLTFGSKAGTTITNVYTPVTTSYPQTITSYQIASKDDIDVLKQEVSELKKIILGLKDYLLRLPNKESIPADEILETMKSYVA